MKLFADQIKPVQECIENLQKKKSVLLYSPTGSGKTAMASAIVTFFNTKTLFIVNRQVLLHQTYETMEAFEQSVSIFHNLITKTPSGKVMSQDYKNTNTLVTLVETLENNNLDFTPELIVIDEAHKGTSAMYQALKEKFPNAMVLGLSASPKRQQNKEGECLTEWYDIMVKGLSVKELIALKRLATPIYKSFDKDEHVVKAWKAETKNCKNRRTIVFVSDTKHSLAVKKAFIESGVKAEIITAGSDLDTLDEIVNCQTTNQRNRIFDKFHKQEIEVLISVSALTEGFDEKKAKYCILLRKVAWVALYHQMVGRVLRWHKDKPTGVILDFAGNFDLHGAIEDYNWDMDEEEQVVVKNNQSVPLNQYERAKRVYIACNACKHVYNCTSNISCPDCNSVNNVKIVANVEQLKNFTLSKLTPEAIKKLKSNNQDFFWNFIEMAKRAVDKNMQFRFNDTYFEIFNEKEFKKEFSWVPLLFTKKKPTLKDKFEFLM